MEPVALKDFFIAFFSSAVVILAGALYALVFAWSKIKRKPDLMVWAYLSYGVLFWSVLVLARVAHLNGYWGALVVAMAVGYLFAPHGIWRLCVGTHPQDRGKGDRG